MVVAWGGPADHAKAARVIGLNGPVTRVLSDANLEWGNQGIPGEDPNDGGNKKPVSPERADKND